MCKREKNVLIDIDGTICDAQERKRIAYEQCLDYLKECFPRLEVQIKTELLNKITTIQFSVFRLNNKNDLNIRFKMLLTFLGVEKKVIHKHLPELNNIYWRNLEEMKVFPKITGLLDIIIENGHLYYLFTDSSTTEAGFKLDRFPPGFLPGNPNVFVTDKDSSDPRIIPLGMEKEARTYQYLREEYGAVAMVGDSPDFDIIPARGGGLEAFDINKISVEDLKVQISKLLC